MIDLNPNHLETVRQILVEHVPACEARAFGSRVTWTAKDYSDLDIAVVGVTALDRSTLARLEEAFEESDLPMEVDVLDWHGISQSFQKVIERDYVVLQEMTDRHSGSVAWSLTTVGEFAPFVYGKALPARARNPEGNIPVFGSNGVVGFHDVALTEGPTVVIGRKGTAGAVHYSSVPCWPIDTTFYFTGKNSDLIRFAFYALKTLGLEGMDTDSAVPGLNRTAAHARALQVPTESEQRAIAHILGTLDDKIELNRRMNQTLEDMARALFKSWFVDFDPVRAKTEGRWRRGHALPGMPADLYDLFPDRLVTSKLGEIPAGWKVGALDDVIELISGGTPKTAVAEYWHGDIPWYTAKDAPVPSDVFVLDTERKITMEGVENSATRILPAGTTVITARGTVGKLACLGIPMSMNQTCYGIRGSSGYPDFFTYLNVRTTVDELQQRTHGTIFDTITRQTFKLIEIVIPPGNTANAFGKEVDTIMSRILSNLHDSLALATLRDTLLPRLISGQLQVTR